MRPAWHDVVASLGAAQGRSTLLALHDQQGEIAEISQEQRRQEEAAWLRMLTERMPAVSWATDAELRLTAFRGTGIEGLDRQPADLVGLLLADTLPRWNGPGESPQVEAHQRALAGQPIDFVADWLGRRLHARVEPLLDPEGVVCGVVGVAVDVTEQCLSQETAARRDGLTGLASRSVFMHGLERAAAAAEGAHRAVLMLDLDDFRQVNEVLGHAGGDRVLVEVARRLTTCVRGGDLAARLGGDTFAALLADVKDMTGAARIAERVLLALAEPVEVDGIGVVPSSCLGIVLVAPGQRPEALLRYAETTLDQAKARGRGNWELFDGPTEPRAMALLRMEAVLRRALEHAEFRQHYEPTLAVKAGKVTGFEVLLWKRSPSASIPKRRV